MLEGRGWQAGAADRDSRIVTASEIADFVYCPEAWRLAQLGHESVNEEELATGLDLHQMKAGAEQIASGTIEFGRVLIWLGLAALGLLWLASR